MSKGISLPVVQSGLEASIQQGVKNVGKINIPATIDPSAFKNLAQPLGRVSGLATEFEKSIAASNARVLAFGASVGIINGVQNAFSDLVKTGIEVQKTLADIAAISGQGGRQLSQFGDALFDIGKTTGQSFKTAAQAALEFSRQGLSVEETLKRTTDALTLTRFTSLNAAEAVDVLTAAANSFSTSGITTAQIINKLVAVDTKFAVSAEDLANGLARAGSIAQEVGVNFDELNAAITVAQERTARGGAVIGNALKTIFTRIRSDETVQALRDIGVESLNAQGQLKGAVPLLQEVAQKIQGLSGGERVQILEAVASKYNINILSALLDDLNNANSKFTQAVSVSAGASNQAYERQIELNKTLAAQINAASVSVTQLFNKLSEIGVTDSLNTLLKFVNDLVNGFNKLLNSEGVGGNIAKGLIKGISDVFFTVGLPIIGAIFIKLTKDIAQFGVESLKTILGVNQQVRERQALEQAVVNTLIRDQEVMASILALSGNRAKQEEYLLGVYNRQLTALQQVQSIASSVTPALMAGGLTATSGQIKKRGAGGYLPAQEAADVRRGVGGANPSSKVVSIPNFAFGGGRRGTMYANTSEYIVPNFANGGSAIFNRDMARAYGLPAGAKKISAAGGYVPNFAIINADEKYAALVGQKLSKQGSGNMGFVQRYVKKSGNTNDFEILRNDPSDSLDKIVFPVYGVPEQSQTAASIDETVKNLERMGKNEAFKIAKAITGGEMPEPEKIAKDRAGFNPGSLSSFAGSIFEASVGALLGDKAFSDYSSQSVTSAFDFDLTKSNKLKNVFGISENSKYLEVKGSFKEGLMDSVAKKIYQVEGIKTREAISTGKIKLQSPTVGERGKNARAFIDKNGKTWIEIANNQFEEAPIGIDLNRYDTRGKKPANPSAATWGSKVGFIPNFAAGSPLGDAINREMAAGVSPSKIRITQDGRLRNSGNPSGLAVINTRDEPNGRIPNFAKLKLESPEQQAARLAKGRAEPMFQSAQRQTIDWEPSPGSIARPMGGGAGPSMQVSYKKWAEEFNKAADSAKEVGKSMDKGKFGMDKMFYAFSGITAATSILEETFKDSNTATAVNVRAGSAIAQGAASGAMALSMLGPYGMLAGGLAGGALAGYKEGIQPLEIQKQQQAEMMKAELSPQGATTEEKIKNLEKTIAFRKNLESRLTRDAANSSIGAGGMFSSQQGASELTDQAKASAEQRVKLTEELAKQKKILDEQKQKEAEIKKEVADRIVLASKIGELNVAYAKGQALAAEHIAAKQAEIITASTSLTAEQRLQREEAQKVYEIEQKIEAVQADTLHNLLKQVASQSKLANVKKEDLAKLQEKFNKGEKINLEDEAKKLGIKDYSQLAAALQTAKESAAIKNIELESEKKRLQILIDANKFNREKTAEYTAQLKLVNYTYSVEKEMQELRDKDKRATDSFDRGNKLRQLKDEGSYRGYNTRQQQRELDYQQSIFDYDQKSEDILKDTIKSQNDNLRNSKDTVKTEVEKIDALKDQAATVAQILKVTKATDLSKFMKDTSNLSGVDLENAKTFNQILQTQINSLAEKDVLLQRDYDRQIALLGLNPRDSEANLRRQLGTTFQGGMYDAIKEIKIEASSFSEDFGKNTTLAFRDGMRDAFSAAISQTDDLNAALQNVAMNFLKSMQNAFLQNAANNAMIGLSSAFPSIFPKIQGRAKGGLITGGSGYRDDVPAMLTGGEFVMRKSAVQKYGAANLAKMNSGGIFLPGVRGGGAISGYDALRAFANQTTTSGVTDILRGGGSSAFINLEDQSSRLSRYALLGDDTINQEIRSAQEQGLNIITEREKYRTEQRKAFQKQLVGTIASAALNYGVGKLVGPLAAKGSTTGVGLLNKTQFLANAKPFEMPKAYGGMIRRYASGGPTDDIPALLMSGEYVMNRGATSRYGRRFLDSMNQGRMSRFADGGEVGTSTTTTESNAKMMGDVSININVSGQNSQTEAQGNTNQGGIDYKKMSERIKAVVLETINEEKRLGGALRTR